MPKPELSLVEKLVYRIQNAAYSHGMTDAREYSSDRKCREASDKSDAAMEALLVEIRATQP